MPQSYLLFNFGTNDDEAQRARRVVEGWKQGFRLGNKLLMKFERGTANEGGAAPGDSVREAETPSENDEITMIVRLDFSDHERLLHERWVARIPTEAPFKDADPKVVNKNDARFPEIAERFEGGPGRPHGFTGPTP